MVVKRGNDELKVLKGSKRFDYIRKSVPKQDGRQKDRGRATGQFWFGVDVRRAPSC